MTKAEYLFLRRAEIPKTLRLLELFPDEKRVNSDLIEGRPIVPAPISPRPSTMAAVITALREAFKKFDAAVDGLTEEAFHRTVNFYGLTLPLSAALMIELLDHIHHRGQFTIYSRMAGARVPQIYGPSRDEP